MSVAFVLLDSSTGSTVGTSRVTGDQTKKTLAAILGNVV